MVFNTLTPFSSLSTPREMKYDLDFNQSKDLPSLQNRKIKQTKNNIIVTINNNIKKSTNQLIKQITKANSKTLFLRQTSFSWGPV